MRFIYIILFIFLSACSYLQNEDSKHAKEYLDFNSLNFQGKSYSIDSEYSDSDFSSKGVLKSNLGSCTNIFNPENAVSYIIQNKKLVGIVVKYENKNVYTSKNISNGMAAENISKNYKGFKIEKNISEGTGDSQEDYVYKIFDNDQQDNILIFDVINDEIQGIHLKKREFEISDCED